MLPRTCATARALRRAQKFPSGASFRIACRAPGRRQGCFSRSFSRSNSCSRFAWSTFIPPYITAPPVVGLLRNPKTSTDQTDRLALAQPNLRLAQHPDSLLRRVILPCHLVLLSKLKIARNLTLKLDRAREKRPLLFVQNHDDPWEGAFWPRRPSERSRPFDRSPSEERLSLWYAAWTFAMWVRPSAARRNHEPAAPVADLTRRGRLSDFLETQWALHRQRPGRALRRVAVVSKNLKSNSSTTVGLRRAIRRLPTTRIAAVSSAISPSPPELKICRAPPLPSQLVERSSEPARILSAAGAPGLDAPGTVKTGSSQVCPNRRSPVLLPWRSSCVGSP